MDVGLVTYKFSDNYSGTGSSDLLLSVLDYLPLIMYKAWIAFWSFRDTDYEKLTFLFDRLPLGID